MWLVLFERERERDYGMKLKSFVSFRTYFCDILSLKIICLKFVEVATRIRYKSVLELDDFVYHCE